MLFLAGLPPVGASLPPGRSDADMGSANLAGPASDVNGNGMVTGGGSNIWNAADQFIFPASAPLVTVAMPASLIVV